MADTSTDVELHTGPYCEAIIDGDRARIAAELDILKAAAAHGAELHVLTVLPSYNMAIVGAYFPPEHEERANKEAQQAIADLLADRREGTKGHVAHGTIYDEILKVADKLACDLIVAAKDASQDG